jgi:hypothetical protein
LVSREERRAITNDAKIRRVARELFPEIALVRTIAFLKRVVAAARLSPEDAVRAASDSLVVRRSIP